MSNIYDLQNGCLYCHNETWRQFVLQQTTSNQSLLSRSCYMITSRTPERLENQTIKQSLRASKPKGINRKAKISYCYIYHREIDLSLDLIFDFWCFTATFNNISAISWCQFYWWRNWSSWRKPLTFRKSLTKCHHKMFYQVNLAMRGIPTHNFSGGRQ